jgi:hypothetical protein
MDTFEDLMTGVKYGPNGEVLSDSDSDTNSNSNSNSNSYAKSFTNSKIEDQRAANARKKAESAAAKRNGADNGEFDHDDIDSIDGTTTAAAYVSGAVDTNLEDNTGGNASDTESVTEFLEEAKKLREQQSNKNRYVY